MNIPHLRSRMRPETMPRSRQFRTVTINIGTGRMRALVVALSVTMAILFFVMSIFAAQLMEAKNQNTVASRFLHSISNQSLNSIIGQEIPLYASADPNHAGGSKEPQESFSSLLFYLFTDVNVEHPETMLGGSIAAMAVSHFEPLTEDSKYQPGDEVPPNQKQGDGQPPSTQPEPVPTKGKPLVYVYHSHNREAYLPDLNGVKDFNMAYDKDKNITLVGEELVKKLEAKQIETIQTKVDYWTMGNFDNAYDYSRKTVQDVLAKNKSIQMVFDIHRDSQPRDKTTAVINGQQVASVYLIVGGSNKDYQKNEEFAKKLHEKMQQMYPGLSKGAYTKRSTAYDTRYNQDLHPQSILFEIGGPENTLEEAKRTADLLADVIASVLADEQKTSQQGK
ncbi:stage II sporulation protein P [Effusibacillus dendaii]|uniref:Stage II sporulation protein P n=1 Tax=Effusibacillus dendaii TaxID=2743772 RepID=A0A7I8DEX7_9BACL|nr:stage II sporulation protein P [Effusibacillus dendaii]BCJ88597.1 stage II sporulation protein P [Effusibacillus dendaii]